MELFGFGPWRGGQVTRHRHQDDREVLEGFDSLTERTADRLADERGICAMTRPRGHEIVSGKAPLSETIAETTGRTVLEPDLASPPSTGAWRTRRAQPLTGGRHAMGGYLISQRKRKHVEEVFGWAKSSERFARFAFEAWRALGDCSSLRWRPTIQPGSDAANIFAAALDDGISVSKSITMAPLEAPIDEQPRDTQRKQVDDTRCDNQRSGFFSTL